MKLLSSKATQQQAFPRFPLPGQRIVRSVLALWCSLVVYYLRGRRGMPFYSIIAALQCVQPYTENALKVGKNRIRGTIVGTFWGTIVLFGELYALGVTDEEGILHYLLLGLFTGVVLYSTVLLKITDSSYFSAVVFLSICMNHIGDENPWFYILNRTLDTMIGVGVALFICALHFPRLRDRSTLYVSGIDHVLFRTDRQLSAFTKVEINRFLQDGMQFSVSTKQTPATVRELLQGVNLRLPIIAMDGAVLYDLYTRKYLVTKKMDEELTVLATDFLHREKMPFFVNTVEDNLLVIYYRDYRDSLLRDLTTLSPGADRSAAEESAAETNPQDPQTADAENAQDLQTKDAENTQDPKTEGTKNAQDPQTADTENAQDPAAVEILVSGQDIMETGSGPETEISVSHSAVAAMHRLYLKKKISPYRNYVRTDHDVTTNVLYLLVIDKKEIVDRLYEALQQEPWFARCRAAFDTFDCEEGEEILRIYAEEANRTAMLAYLQEYVGAERTVTFGNTPGTCDVLIPDTGGEYMVKQLKKRFEPVSLRGWKNMFRL